VPVNAIAEASGVTSNQARSSRKEVMVIVNEVKMGEEGSPLKKEDKSILKTRQDAR
jgi:hypothetical protein